jgi:hypothetical protein
MNPSISLVLSRTFPAILTKSECYALYHNDLFGNKVQTWKTVEDIYSSGWNKRVCIRGKQKGISRSATRYNVPLSELESTIQEMGLEGIPKENLTFNQEMPDPHLTIQGELILTYRGIDLTYTDIKKPMNLALAEKTLWASGLSALNLIKSNFWELVIRIFKNYFKHLKALLTLKVL